MHLLKTKTFLVLLILVVQSANAQLVKELFNKLHKDKDSTYISVFNESIITKVSLNTQSNLLSIVNNQEITYRLSTNNIYRLNFSVDYDFLGISFGFAPSFIPENNDDDKRGSSSFRDINFRFLFKRWIQTLQYKKESGFYAENTKDLMADWNQNTDPYITFPDLQTTLWEGTTSYLFNENFSLKNSVNNHEWQRKSAGSFIPTLRYNYSSIDSNFEVFEKHNKTLQFYLTPNYYYTWVIKNNWFVTGALGGSFGLRFALDSSLEKTDTYIPFLLNGSIQSGYNSNNLTFGVNLFAHSVHHNYFEQDNIVNDHFYLNFYFGYRFKASKKIENFFKKIKQKTEIK